MELLERIWEILSSLFNGLGRMVERSITSLFGSSNARYVKKLQPKVDAINALEPKYQAMTDDELQAADGRVSQAAGRGRNARRPAGRGLCRLPRGGPPLPRHAALRRAAHRRHGPAQRGISPKWSPAKARRWSPRCRPISTRWTARACTSSRSTTTWPAATWNGWARSTWAWA